MRQPRGYNVKAMRNGRIARYFWSFQHDPYAIPTCLR